jgi:drug/metabolite transporter (DMT)-like permease
MSIVAPLQARSENLRGITALLAAMAVFVVNDTLMKVASASLPMGEAIFLRGLTTTVLCTILLYNLGYFWTLPQAASPRMLTRALADVGSAFFFLGALVHMPIGDVFGILQFTPLAITAGAAMFLGARVGWRRWLATIVGFAGVLIIVRPGGAGFTPYAILALLSVLCATARDLLTRSLPLSVPSLIIVGGSSAVVTLVSGGFALLERWIWPPSPAMLAVLTASIALLAGQHWLVIAMRAGEIAVVAPFRYSIILWAIASGFLVWGEVPDLASWVGMAVVSAAGLYTFLREQWLAKAAAK